MPITGSVSPARVVRDTRLVLATAFVQLGLGCARQGLPEGGPPDTESPRVVASEPDSGATRVPLDADVAITFSEPMSSTTILDAIVLSPPRDFARRGWRGNTFHLEEGEEMAPNVTTTVIVDTGVRDERAGNPMGAPYLFVFTTGDSLDSGRIEGRLLANGQIAHGTWVWALDIERAAARPDTILPDYLTQAASDSTFTFIGLKPGRRYRVLAHYDANRDREFDRETEFFAAFPDTVWLDPADPVVRGMAIDYRDPRAPGSIAGTVADSTGLFALPDTARATGTTVPADTAMAPPDTTPGPAAADTTRVNPFWVEAWLQVLALPPREGEEAQLPDTTAAAQAQPDSAGAYVLRNLDPGLYRVQAFLDQDGDRRYDAAEPASAPADSVRVLPLEETADVNFVVRPTR